MNSKSLFLALIVWLAFSMFFCVKHALHNGTEMSDFWFYQVIIIGCLVSQMAYASSISKMRNALSLGYSIAASVISIPIVATITEGHLFHFIAIAVFCIGIVNSCYMHLRGCFFSNNESRVLQISTKRFLIGAILIVLPFIFFEIADCFLTSVVADYSYMTLGIIGVIYYGFKFKAI
ncbi:MAG: hypothetical protein IKR18_07555 [Bacteroidaceae bacterium]|nr:hypothetical protein [Bacteroidaceae bacterium]